MLVMYMYMQMVMCIDCMCMAIFSEILYNGELACHFHAN